MELICDMLISPDGSVDRANFVKSSGDKDWDAQAITSIMKWKFTPPMYNEKPIKLLIRRKIKIQFAEPEIINLAEIVIINSKQADSVYKALIAGADFNQMVNKFSISPSRLNNGILGETNIQNYSRNIWSILSNLKEGEFTPPISYGPNYVIFKRLKRIESVDKKEIIKTNENFFYESKNYVAL